MASSWATIFGLAAMKILLLFAVLALACAQDDYCFGKDPERSQTRHFTSKTAYAIIRGTNMDKQYLVPGCEPKKIWIFHRHGTRLPDKKTIKKAPRLEELRDLIVKNYRVLKTKPDTNALCQEDLLILQTWKWNNSITQDQSEHLTSQGYVDLRGTAKTYQHYYPTVLRRDYDDSYYLFRHTDTQRTKESFKAFSEALFGENSGARAEEVPKEDRFLRPYDFCSSYDEQNYKGPGSENAKYKLSHIWNDTMSAISTRLGFQYTLATDDIELMYDMCRYEQAWYVERSGAWCAAFLPEQVNVLEYGEDLKYYYKAGYGFEDNQRLNCRVVQDLLTQLSSTAAPHAIAYFAHSLGLQTLITSLGIDKDDNPLTAANSDSQAYRRWRTSNIDPFAANFVAVKYECAADPLETEKVVFFLNQEAVRLDWCNVGLCNWSEVLLRYKIYAEANCGSYYCRAGSAASFSAVSIAVTTLLAAIVYLIH